MTENSHETPDPPGIEIDYAMDETGGMHAAIVVRDPAKLRKTVDVTLRFLPSVFGDPETGYKGTEDLKAKVDSDEGVMLPMMIVSHMPSNMPEEEALEHVEHTMYVLRPHNVVDMINGGIDMFIDDPAKAQVIKHMLFHILGGEHEHNEDEDDAQG